MRGDDWKLVVRQKKRFPVDFYLTQPPSLNLLRPENLDAARVEMQKHFKVDWEQMMTACSQFFDAVISLYGSMGFCLVGFYDFH